MMTRSLRASLAAPVLLSLIGCAGAPPVGDPRNRLADEPPAADRIYWPPLYVPERATFFVHNEIEVAASPEAVWRELIRAEAWPEWYEGATDVRVVGSESGELAHGASIEWRTMGLGFTSVIHEFEPPYRLAWESRRADITGYHAWLIVPTEAGCRVITDESQFGLLAYAQIVFQPSKLRRLHDVWLAELKRRAEQAEGASS